MSTQGSAAAVLHRAALLYAENLLNRYVLFIGEHGEPVETFYSANSFRHLCGYRYKDHISAKLFFDRAVKNTLSDKLLEPIYANNTRAKLRILPTVMCIDTRASFLIQNPALPGKTIADVVCGHVDAIIGYRDTGACMVPCTALQMNDMTAGRETIIGIVKTEKNKTEYAILSKRVKPQDPKLTAREKRIHAVLQQLETSQRLSPSLSRCHKDDNKKDLNE